MKFFDITLPLSPVATTWPGERPVKIVESRGSAITSRLDIPSHIGTHIDAPKHFLFNQESVDRIPLSKLFGPVRIIASNAHKLIGLKELKDLKISPHDKLLFKTRNGKLLGKKKFDANYIALDLPAANYLALKKIDLVGIDYFGIEAKSAPGHPVHKTLLKAGIVIVEGLDLRKITPGKYMLAALPLKIKKGDGAPARAVLWR